MKNVKARLHPTPALQKAVDEYAEEKIKGIQSRAHETVMKPVKCPHCGEIVCYKNLDEEWTRGKEWMKLLEDIGYYTPYDDSKSHAENFPYYADDMILSDKQIKTLLDQKCRPSANVEPEEVVGLVEEWSKAHPVKTRQSEFLKQFPNAKLDIDGVLAIRPCDIDSKYCTDDDYLRKCGACAGDYWLAEVTDNGND